MKKLLLTLIIILLCSVAYVSLANGIVIGDFKILSIAQIDQSSKDLTAKIEEVSTLTDTNFPKKLSELNSASDKMETSKKAYLSATNFSTDEQIIQAMQEESYSIEFLWAKVGNHATKEGVNLKLEIVASSTGTTGVNDLKFTVDGSYIGITNFIYAIENDTDLNFRIHNFKLLPYQGSEVLQGTFTVKNVVIQGNSSNKSVTSNTNKSTNTTNTTNTTADTNNTTAQNTVQANNTVQ